MGGGTVSNSKRRPKVKQGHSAIERTYVTCVHDGCPLYELYDRKDLLGAKKAARDHTRETGHMTCLEYEVSVFFERVDDV